VFRSFWALDPLYTMTYRALRPIWHEVPRDLVDVRTYSGFKPTWNPHVARGTMLITKALGRTFLYRRAVSYEAERRRIVWRKSA